jgi:hypothetical protein
MVRRLGVFLMCLLIAYGCHWLTKDRRMKKALGNVSQFAELNTARAEQKPMLVSIDPPGCPWAAHATEEIAKVRPKLKDRVVFMELRTSVVTTTGSDPFDDLTSKCHVGLRLFNPSNGKVKDLDELIEADELERELVAFSAP